MDCRRRSGSPSQAPESSWPALRLVSLDSSTADGKMSVTSGATRTARASKSRYDVGNSWVESEMRVLNLPAGGSPRLPSRDAARLSTRGPSRLRRSARWYDLDGGRLRRSAHTVPRIGDEDPVTEVMVGSRDVADRQAWKLVGRVHGRRSWSCSDLRRVRGRRGLPDSGARPRNVREGGPCE